MPILEAVSEALKSSMKARDAARTSALRNIRAAFIAAMKEDGSQTLSDERCQAALRTLAKQRKESLEVYGKAGRADLADAEAAELAVIEEYLPKVADEATTRAWVADAIAATGASGRGDVGKVMGVLMRDHKAELDGKLAKQLVAEALGG